jgi:ornithine carbamoyltransferase
LKESLTDWYVDEPWFESASTNCGFMHCLPVRRGVEVDARVLDGPRSLVIVEARNRMLVQMAVLYRMLKT